MKIAIVSDSHDNVPNIDKMVAYVVNNQVEVMLHCGDVCAPGVLKYIAEKFLGKIYLVYGNVDGDHANMQKFSQLYPNIHLLGDENEVVIDRLLIAMVHYPEEAKRLAQAGKYDYVFYGHNHRPWEEKIGKTELVNPGTLGGLFQKATFAILDTQTKELELIVLEKL